ncbi:MAG: DUF3047 domain-containing protein [Pseudomonadota bacterium]
MSWSSPNPTHGANYQELTELQALSHYLTGSSNKPHVKAVRFMRLAGNQPPWQSTGLSVNKGESFSLFARGRINWTKRQPNSPISPRPPLYGDPSFHLWARISPNGKITNLTADSGTFVADSDGLLELGIYMGMWRNEHGALTHTDNYEHLSGELVVVAVIWRHEVKAGLPVLSNCLPTPPSLVAEHTRLSRKYRLPPGWRYLTETGHHEIFHHHHLDDQAQISVDARNAQGIIRYPLERTLSKSLTLKWQWRLDEHPSVGPEDRARFHDYVSIALEFDNGRDLTWIWSRFLNEDHHFHCPVRDWTCRETHYVVRTGSDPLSKWVHEERVVYDDVALSQGEPSNKVVAVWLIAVSTFSHNRLRASFRNISLQDEQELRIL